PATRAKAAKITPPWTRRALPNRIRVSHQNRPASRVYPESARTGILSSNAASGAAPEPHDEDLEARLAGPLGADSALILEERFHTLFGLRKIGAHEDLADELSPGAKQRRGNVERARKELEALGLIRFARPGRARRHVR